MWKIVATVVSMLVSGVVTFYTMMFILMELGLRFHNNFEYYARYPVLLFGPAAIAFLAPGVVVWYLKRRDNNRRQNENSLK